MMWFFLLFEYKGVHKSCVINVQLGYSYFNLLLFITMFEFKYPMTIKLV